MVVRHDCVVAALHVFDGGSHVVAITWVGTCAASVIAVETKAMCPAVVHVEPVIGDNGLHTCR